MENMIRATHGFDCCDPGGALLGWDFTSHANDFDFSRVQAGKPGTGSGNCFYPWFDSFGYPTLTRIFDPQSFWVCGLDAAQYYNLVGPGPATQSRFLEMSDSISAMIGLQFEADGSISIQDLVHSTEIGRSPAPLYSPGSWGPYMELRCSGFGGSGVSCELWLDDVKQASGSAAIGGRFADRVTIRQQGVGVQFDNIYMLDGQGASPWNDRLGPVRITALLPSADASGSWGVTPTTTAAWEAVLDALGVDPNGTPDGDSSYVTPDGVGSNEMFFVSTAPCYGLVLGVTVNACFRGTSGAASLTSLFLEGSASHVLGTLSVSGGYHTAQQIVGYSPETGTFFNDAEIAGNLWGFSTASLDLRVTQLYLEKIVSLRSTPYGCGKQNYSF